MAAGAQYHSGTPIVVIARRSEDGIIGERREDRRTLIALRMGRNTG